MIHHFTVWPVTSFCPKAEFLYGFNQKCLQLSLTRTKRTDLCMIHFPIEEFLRSSFQIILTYWKQTWMISYDSSYCSERASIHQIISVVWSRVRSLFNFFFSFVVFLKNRLNSHNFYLLKRIYLIEDQISFHPVEIL